MKKGRFTEEQIIGVLKEHEAGRKVPDLAREIGVSAATIYTWKSRFGGMEVSDAQKLKGLEDENRRLKHLVADLSLDKEVLKAVIQKNGWSLRDECLNANWFRNLMDARAKIGAWRDEYNGERPHSSLGYRTPNEFAAILKSSVMTG